MAAHQKAVCSARRATQRTKMKVLVTGAAGFIGSHVALRLLARGDSVIGVDNLNDYYDPALKRARLARFGDKSGYTDVRADIGDRAAMAELFAKQRPDRVVHLAAQAGVRYSLTNPQAYIDTNVVGFGNILEGCRHAGVQHLVYASSSSVYGANTTLPFAVRQNVDHPLSLYAATKKANELMAHTYSSIFGLPTTGLRFFTVYGPWGRPDMALFLFTRNILEGKPVDVFNHGKHSRGFTYIDDIVEGIVRVVDATATPDPEWSGTAPNPSTSAAPYRIYNIGSNTATPLMRYIELIEQVLGRKATINYLPLQAGDVPDSCADVEDLMHAVGYRPTTPVEVGVRNFVEWYRRQYDV
jgi:UDP-glucuronate 4-epimerase